MEPTPNREIMRPASDVDRFNSCVTYKPIKGTATWPHRLINITALKSHVSLAKPEKEFLYVAATCLSIRAAR
jgi:hypothetical protein